MLLIYRFRRERLGTDVEKGDSKDGKDADSIQTRKVSSSAEDTGGSARTVRGGKWGRLLGESLF